jgi:lipopolysaccharide/colanic/teichoic acid biosynthesis glycosyltransferase
LALEVKQPLLLPGPRLAKAVMDRSLGGIFFLLSAPLIALLALVIRIVSPGPAFFTQIRDGLNGNPIGVLKLRTMHLDAEAKLQEYLGTHPEAKLEWEKFFKLKNDPRIIPLVGKLIRKLSLDELPQLLNVVRGEMALVGPRPFPYYHLESFGEEFRTLRRRVKPGLTGLWQISARSEGDLEVQEFLDTYYIRNWSPWLDIYILARTVRVVIFGYGAY